MSILGASRRQFQMPQMNFLAPPGVTQMGPEAFLTPQEKYAAQYAAKGGAVGNFTGAGGGGVGASTVSGPAAPAAGGVPGQGGGAAPVDPLAALPEGGGQQGGNGGGIMQMIMKYLPMIMGG